MGLTLTIPKRMTHGEELVVLRRDEYEQLIRHAEETAEALRVIAGEEKLELAKERRNKLKNQVLR